MAEEELWRSKDICTRTVAAWVGSFKDCLIGKLRLAHVASMKEFWVSHRFWTNDDGKMINTEYKSTTIIWWSCRIYSFKLFSETSVMRVAQVCAKVHSQGKSQAKSCADDEVESYWLTDSKYSQIVINKRWWYGSLTFLVFLLLGLTVRRRIVMTLVYSHFCRWGARIWVQQRQSSVRGAWFTFGLDCQKRKYVREE